MGAGLPLLLLASSLRFSDSAFLFLCPALLVHLIGVITERWLFFAEARHAVMSYYD